jgi:hypothetical protein
MKISWLVLVVILFVVGCTPTDNHVMREKKFYVSGSSDGEPVRQRWLEAPTDSAKTHYVMDGKFEEFYYSGQRNIVGQYRMGDKVGQWWEYRKDGSVRRRWEYDGKDKRGREIEVRDSLFHPDGKYHGATCGEHTVEGDV